MFSLPAWGRFSRDGMPAVINILTDVLIEKIHVVEIEGLMNLFFFFFFTGQANSVAFSVARSRGTDVLLLNLKWVMC